MFYGTEEEFWSLYRAAAEAIKAADRRICVGALGVSSRPGTRRILPGRKDDDSPYDHSMLKGFIDFIGKNPEVPVDFVCAIYLTLYEAMHTMKPCRASSKR